MSDCPSESQLQLLADGRLPLPRAESLLRHLDECAECRARVEASRGSLDGLVRAAAGSDSDRPLALDRAIEAVLATGDRSGTTVVSDSSEHGFLFCLFAMHMNRLTVDQFAAVSQQWLSDRSVPLWEIARTEASLTDSDCREIETAIHRFTAWQRDLPGDETWTSDQASAVGPSSERPSSDRFRALRLHAQGGLGTISVAEDLELNREVALKTIREDLETNQDAVARFLLEAEITGALEHPGIVPVYGLGRGSDGKPHYAMRFVRGESLKEATQRVHAMADAEQRARELRRLLQRFVEVCNALEYAHSRGVIHRDLKPANIMLGKYGETLVVDWGLAKAQGRDEYTRVEDETTLRPDSGNESDTRAGRALGTPDFMPPEQARGDLSAIGPASDVYSLGATLFYVLTAEHPFAGMPVNELLKQVQVGRFRRPSAVNPTVPAALEAVCLKAMATTPTDRYDSPRLLADEIERHLADEPVLAHNDDLATRGRRWMRKRPRLVASLAAGALICLVALATLDLLVASKNEELGKAVLALDQSNTDLVRQEKETQAALAAELARRGQLREALDAISSQVINDWLLRQRKFDQSQRDFLNRALALYDDFAADTRDDRAAQLGRIEALRQVGQIRKLLGDSKEAIACYQRALQLLMEPTFDASGHCATMLADSHYQLGILLSRSGRRDEAERSFESAMEEYQQLSDQGGDYRHEIAGNHHSLGRLYFARGSDERALEEYNKALGLRRSLIGESPENDRHQFQIARLFVDQALALKYLDRGPEAERAYLEGIEIMAQLPQSPTNQWLQGVLHNDLGVYYKQQGDRPAAARLYSKAMELREDLVQQFPNDSEYNVMLLGSCLNLGNLLRIDGQHEDSLKIYDRGSALAADMLGRDENYVRARQFARNVREGEAETWMALDDFRKALAAWDKSIAHNDQKFNLGEPRFEVRLPLRRAVALVRLGRVTEATAIADRILSKASSEVRSEAQYHAAAVFAVASAKSGSQQQDKLSDRALSLLTSALEDDYRGSDSKGFAWHEDPELKEVADHPEYSKLLERFGPSAE